MNLNHLNFYRSVSQMTPKDLPEFDVIADICNQGEAREMKQCGNYVVEASESRMHHFLVEQWEHLKDRATFCEDINCVFCIARAVEYAIELKEYELKLEEEEKYRANGAEFRAATPPRLCPANPYPEELF